jgi:hypothetical protein
LLRLGDSGYIWNLLSRKLRFCYMDAIYEEGCIRFWKTH